MISAIDDTTAQAVGLGLTATHARSFRKLLDWLEERLSPEDEKKLAVGLRWLRRAARWERALKAVETPRYRRGGSIFPRLCARCVARAMHDQIEQHAADPDRTQLLEWSQQALFVIAAAGWGPCKWCIKHPVQQERDEATRLEAQASFRALVREGDERAGLALVR